LIVSGAHYKTNYDGSADVLSYYYTPFNVLHNRYKSNDIVQIRGIDNSDTLSLLTKKNIPQTLDIKSFKDKFKNIEIIWGQNKTVNLQRESSVNTFTEIYLPKNIRKKILANRLAKIAIQRKTDMKKVDGFLLQWFSENKFALAPKYSNLYKPPTTHELLFFQEEILKPILDYQKLSAELRDEIDLQLIQNACVLIGYQLILYTEKISENQYLILTEAEQTEKKFWGIYCFSLNPKNKAVIETPNPLSEFVTFEYACNIFREYNCNLLLVAGAHALANKDQSSNVASYYSPASIFHLTHQTATNYYDTQTLFMQIRGYDNKIDNTIIISNSREKFTSDFFPEEYQIFNKIFKYANTKIEYFNDQPDKIAFDNFSNKQRIYSSLTNKNNFISIFIPYKLRKTVITYNIRENYKQIFEHLKIPMLETPITKIITTLTPIDVKLKDFVIQKIPEFLITNNILIIQELIDACQRKGYYLRYALDLPNNYDILIIYDKTNNCSAIINLSAQNNAIISANNNFIKKYEEFLKEKALLIIK